MLIIALFALFLPAHAEDDTGPHGLDEEAIGFEEEPGNYWDGNCLLTEPNFRFYIYLPATEYWFPEYSDFPKLEGRWKKFNPTDWMPIIWSPANR